MAVGRPPPGKCLQLFILLVDIDSQGQEISEVAFRTETLIWVRLKVSFSTRASASTKWLQLLFQWEQQGKGSSLIWGVGGCSR